MPQTFFDRLRNYYMQVGTVLRGEADAASIFPNSTDVGMSREKVYAEFLRLHTPSKCNVFLGGYVFDEDGNESKQLDIIITTDTAPRFDFHNKGGSGKSFSPVEGTLGVVSVKSMLDSNGLNDALKGIASIPATRSLTDRVNPNLTIPNYDDWPLKVIYAVNGLKADTLLNHLDEFYEENNTIPLNRRPDFIHVAGSCFIVRAFTGMSLFKGQTSEGHVLNVGSFYSITHNPDLQAIVWVLHKLQERASSSTQILFLYDSITNKVGGRA